jgi:sporulation protein YlmC with PRC-barrel domain
MTEATEVTSGALIAATKVKGTTVYNLAGENLGSVENIMIDKATGRAIYAVMSFPLPWATLKYDTKKGGYMVNLDKKMLTDAPSFDRNAEFNWTPDYGRSIDGYYKTQSHDKAA